MWRDRDAHFDASVKMILCLVVASLLLASAGGQEVLSSCPSPNGFFADAVQCDKYYHCVDSVMTEKLCPDGMAFNELNPKVEKCDFLFQANCEGRPQLQTPKPAENCPRQNGYFPHEDPTNCREFFLCTAGISSMITCPESLSFSMKTGTCVWPEDSGRTNCVSEKVHNFTCPKVGSDAADVHPRYADPQDCQYFYVCINGETPRRNGCSFGQVFNTESGTCDNPKDVPDCVNHYTDFFDDYFSTLGDNTGGRVNADIVAAAMASGYEIPQFRERVRIRPGEGVPPRRGTAQVDVDSRPAGRPLRRRPAGAKRPLRRRNQTTTTTTTTTTLPPDDYYYYYYDEYDYVDNSTASAI
ncbi:chitin binding [Halocaridina rubra]|uniref:Chitin binding n=1 Tax=Halocaridina rubra TaxID=373956 RepID=A0AAN8XV39_HALRR